MKTYKNIVILVASILILSSCENLLETEPSSTLSNEEALNDYNGFFATLMGAYDKLRDVNYYQRDFIIIADALADNSKQTANNSARLDGVSNNQPYAHFNFWRVAYEVINSANFVILSVDNITDATVEELNQIQGEALFLRALAHFDLVRAYARNPNYSLGDPLGIPIITKPTFTNDVDFPSRNSISEVYSHIISDLEKALSLINKRNNLPNRASDIAVQALLSRIHLYAGNWDKTIIAADYVIENVGFDIEINNYSQIFAGASETIFGLTFLSNENPGLNGSLEGLLYKDEKGIGYADFVVRDDLFNLHESGDHRKNLYKQEQKEGENVTFTGKYLGYLGEFGLDNIPLIRLSEIILTRAEAKGEKGDLAGAISDLNKIRNRAGLENTTVSNTNKEELLKAILKERRIELAFEGHRIFDLKRRGLDISKGIPNTDCQNECLIPYNDFRIIANIPISEIEVNMNLKQNPGY